MIRDLRRHTGGFTILESIIVLTVMSALLASALLLFKQRVPRAQFAKAVNELSVRLTDTYYQVAEGRYQATEDFDCDAPIGGGLNISNGGSDQGTNQGCIFIGQAVQFGNLDGSNGGTCSAGSPNDSCDTLRVYTIAGRRLKAGGGSADNLDEADATIIRDYAKQTYVTGYGLYVTKVKSSTNNIGGIAYTQSFGARMTGSGPSGAPQINIAPLPNTHLGMNDPDFATGVPPRPATDFATPAPSDGILICLRSAGSDQYATITLGAGSNPSSVDQAILSKTDWTSKCS